MTDVPSRIREVWPAIAARTTSGALIAKSGAVVLADAEEVEPDLVGEDRLRDHLPDRLGVPDQGSAGAAGRVALEVAEGVEAEGRGLRGSQEVDVHDTILAGPVGMGHGNRG